MAKRVDESRDSMPGFKRCRGYDQTVEVTCIKKTRLDVIDFYDRVPYDCDHNFTDHSPAIRSNDFIRRGGEYSRRERDYPDDHCDSSSNFFPRKDRNVLSKFDDPYIKNRNLSQDYDLSYSSNDLRKLNYGHQKDLKDLNIDADYELEGFGKSSAGYRRQGNYRHSSQSEYPDSKLNKDLYSRDLELQIHNITLRGDRNYISSSNICHQRSIYERQSGQSCAYRQVDYNTSEYSSRMTECSRDSLSKFKDPVANMDQCDDYKKILYPDVDMKGITDNLSKGCRHVSLKMSPTPYPLKVRKNYDDSNIPLSQTLEKLKKWQDDCDQIRNVSGDDSLRSSIRENYDDPYLDSDNDYNRCRQKNSSGPEKCDDNWRGNFNECVNSGPSEYFDKFSSRSDCVMSKSDIESRTYRISKRHDMMKSIGNRNYLYSRTRGIEGCYNQQVIEDTERNKSYKEYETSHVLDSNYDISGKTGRHDFGPNREYQRENFRSYTSVRSGESWNESRNSSFGSEINRSRVNCDPTKRLDYEPLRNSPRPGPYRNPDWRPQPAAEISGDSFTDCRGRKTAKSVYRPENNKYVWRRDQQTDVNYEKDEKNRNISLINGKPINRNFVHNVNNSPESLRKVDSSKSQQIQKDNIKAKDEVEGTSNLSGTGLNIKEGQSNPTVPVVTNVSLLVEKNCNAEVHSDDDGDDDFGSDCPLHEENLVKEPRGEVLSYEKSLIKFNVDATNVQNSGPLTIEKVKNLMGPCGKNLVIVYGNKENPMLSLRRTKNRFCKQFSCKNTFDQDTKKWKAEIIFADCQLAYEINFLKDSARTKAATLAVQRLKEHYYRLLIKNEYFMNGKMIDPYGNIVPMIYHGKRYKGPKVYVHNTNFIKLQKMVYDYSCSDDVHDLVFSVLLAPKHSKELVNYAKKDLNLVTRKFGPKKWRFLVISKKIDMWLIVKGLIDKDPKFMANYQLLRPTKTKT